MYKTKTMFQKYLANCAMVMLLFCEVSLTSCSKPAATPTPTDPCAGKTIVVTGTSSNSSGGTATNGGITASASGSSSFTFSINGGPFQSSGSFVNLAAGSYTITAKDGSNCTGTQSFVVTATACPSIVLTGTTTAAASPTATNGTITASATGSTGITYSLNNGTFQATGAFTGLASGSYTINARDVNGCSASAAFVISVGSCPTITVTVNTTMTSGPTSTNGRATATAAGGLAAYNYSINGGTSFQLTGTFANLTAGNYTIISRDANGCLGSSGSFAIASAPCPNISLSSATTGSDKCTNNTGTITLSAAGSTGLMYNLNGGNFQTSPTFMALGTGGYIVSVRDANGCSTPASVQVSVGNAGPLFTNVKAIMVANCTGCHGGTSPQNGLNFNDDCTIVALSARIKARAVDGSPSFMPQSGPIPASDRQKIVDWINAGGQHRN